MATGASAQLNLGFSSKADTHANVEPVECEKLSRGVRIWACAIGCLIRANPLGLRIHANCESARQARLLYVCMSTVRTPCRKRLWQGDLHNIKKACESLSDSCESVSFANPCELRITIPGENHRVQKHQSVRMSPVLDWRSLPAKSTKLSLPTRMCWSSPVLSLVSTVTVKMEWLRLESWFIRVAPTVRFFFPTCSGSQPTEPVSDPPFRAYLVSTVRLSSLASSGQHCATLLPTRIRRASCKGNFVICGGWIKMYRLKL